MTKRCKYNTEKTVATCKMNVWSFSNERHTSHGYHPTEMTTHTGENEWISIITHIISPMSQEQA